MAVTQQLARLNYEKLRQCRTDEVILGKLISYTLLKIDDYIDLCWAPKGLHHFAEASNQLPEVRLALFMALNGSTLVNKAHRDRINNYSVYSDISMLFPDDVKKVSEYFNLFDRHSFINWLPRKKEDALKLTGDYLKIHPNDYYLEKMENLILFYKGASNRYYGTISWWD